MRSSRSSTPSWTASCPPGSSSARASSRSSHSGWSSAPYHEQHNHHWFCRANNYLALGRLEDARTAFLKTIELTGNGEHVEAKARLAATLMALGKKREARNLGKRVQHVIGTDPTNNWEPWLDVWARQSWPPPPTGTGGPSTTGKRKKVGRNEPCPCGSGTKFKRCCGR